MILVFSAAVVSAQTSTAAISGVVSDSSGAVIADAKVTANNEATGVSLSQQTTANGVYSVIAGCLMGFFYPQLMKSISPDFNTRSSQTTMT